MIKIRLIQDRMKFEIREKYVLSLFSARLMDKWYRYTQGNKSGHEHVQKFDEFLINVMPLTLKD